MASQAENALIGRAALQTFQPGDLVALRCNEPLQIGQLAQQFHQQSFQLGTWQIGQTGGRRHATSESYSPAFDKPKKPELPGVMPRLPDYDAVRAALTLAWSNGPVEGQINRLKNPQAPDVWPSQPRPARTQVSARSLII